MSFRYHAASLAAVLFALAAGVALGAGVLGGERLSPTEDEDTAAASALRSFENAYARHTASEIVADALDGSDVMIFELPGTSRALLEAVSTSIGDAEGRVAGTVALTEKLLDSANRQFADGVAQQSTDGIEGVGSAEGSYGRVGAALARAYLSGERARLDSDARAVASAFVEGELITERQEPERAGTVAVFLAGTDAPEAGGGTILGELAEAIDAGGVPVLVAGPSAQSADDGYIAAIAESDAAGTVSTFDVLDSPAGRALLPLIIAAEIDGESGAYGTSRAADGPFPEG